MSANGPRPPPEIIRLAPPLVPLRRVWADFKWASALVMGIGGGGLLLVFALFAKLAGGLNAALAAGLTSVFLTPVLCVLAVPVLLLPGVLWTRHVENRRVNRWRRKHPEALADSRAVAVLQELETTGRVDYSRLATLLRCGGAGAGPCCIAVDERTQPLTATAALTEPVVIGPGRILPLSAAGAFGVWGAVMIGAVVAVRFLRLSRFAALLLLLAGPVAGWMVYSLLRPRYVRFAPGRIELLRYYLSASQPRVTIFPLDGDTVIFIGTRDGDADARRLGFPMCSGGWR